MKQRLPNGGTFRKADEFKADDHSSDMPPTLDVPLSMGGEQPRLVTCVHAEFSTLNSCATAGRQPVGVIALVGRSTHGFAGMYMPLDANHARGWAATLLAMANALDGGKGRQ